MRTLLAVLLLTGTALADLRNDSPARVMGYLDPSGLTVRGGWRKWPQSGWTASSTFINFPGPQQVPQTSLRAQYAGHETHVTEATLWLNATAGPDEVEPLAALVDAAAKLTMAAGGTALTQAMRDAMLSKTPLKETVNGYRISVVYVQHGRGPGYSLRFMIQSEAGGFPVDGPPAILTDRVKES